MTGLRSVKGMHDVLPAQSPVWQELEAAFRACANAYGFAEIRTPVLEPVELFVRGIGDTTDIVEKEMYVFEDKGGDRLALRPEGTASVVRAFVQHAMDARPAVHKMYYIGPMFRRERPAKGRYRQFYQAGAELFGVATPEGDAEMIAFAVRFLRAAGISDVVVQINSLGDGDSRAAFRQALRAYYEPHRDVLCPDCVNRLERNPLRLLDCKVPGCVALKGAAPSVLDYLSEEAAAHFGAVRALLDAADIPYEVVPTMVRGLDYYNHTIFEVQGTGAGLGAQSTLVGGGRYDGLVAQLGGKPTPTVGFALGIERLLLALGDREPRRAPAVFVAGVGQGGDVRAFVVAQQLRAAGIRTVTPYGGGSLRAALKKADKAGADWVVLCGEDEARQQAVTVRSMADGSQELVAQSALVAVLAQKVAS